MISLRDVVTGFGNRDPMAEVWRRNLRGGGAAEITGFPPLRYIGDGRPLTDYLISGNTVQDGTPTPEAPVDVVGCGVRTGNLFTGEYSQFDNVGGSGSLYAYFYAPNTTVTLIAKDDHTVSSDLYFGFTANGGGAVAGQRWVILPGKQFVKGDVITRTIPDGFSFVSLYRKSEASFKEITDHFYVMLNSGSTALPYEPYGYKIPLTINTTEYPIYLGQVETTRRIKKLVLTGEEVWFADWRPVAGAYATLLSDKTAKIDHVLLCTHLEPKTYNQLYLGTAIGVSTVPSGSYLIAIRVPDTFASNDAEFKSYLAAQYAAGTPVTVWYVLAEPETAVVNEPLHKIGGYADTVSFAQAGVTIPTVNGENILDVPTEVPPSEVTIKGGISSV